MPAFILSTDADISIAGQIFGCLFINTAMAFGFQLILAHECSGGNYVSLNHVINHRTVP